MKIYKVSFVWLLFLPGLRIKSLRRNNINTKLPSATQEEKSRVESTTARSLLRQVGFVRKDVSSRILAFQDLMFRGLAMAFKPETYDTATYTIPVYSDAGKLYSRAPSIIANVLCR